MNHLPEGDSTAVGSLSAACRMIGREVPRWTQGAGGNVSQKAGTSLWIKASGCRLDQVGQTLTTLARADLAVLREVLLSDALQQRQSPESDEYAEQRYTTTLAMLSDTAFGRASMETGFHALLPKAFVAHFHALSALVMACAAKREPERWARFCGTQDVPIPARLPFVRPGLLLSQAVHALPPFEICLLENHGVILHGEDAKVIERWARFEHAFCRAWGVNSLRSGGAAVRAGAHVCGRWKILFPDAAIFGDRVTALVHKADAALWQLSDDAMARDRDATELWIATQLLQHACPEIQELTPETAQALVHLPTERWREKQSRLS